MCEEEEEEGETGGMGGGPELSHDVLMKILSCTDARSLMQAAAVSRAWLRAASSTAVVRAVSARALNVCDVIVDEEEDDNDKADAGEAAVENVGGKQWNVAVQLGPLGEAMARMQTVLERRSAPSTASTSSSVMSRPHTSTKAKARPAPLFVAARRVRIEAGSTLARLAILYDTDPGAIKRLNMLSSEAGIACRAELLVPLVINGERGSGVASNAAGIMPATTVARYERDEESQRSLFVLYSLTEYYEKIAGGSQDETSSSAGTKKVRDIRISEESDASRARRRRGSRGLPGASNERDTDFARLLALKSVKRSIKCSDDDVVTYYLDAADGDINTAIQMAQEDERWAATRHRRR